LRQKIDNKKSDIAGLQAEIRSLENTAARERNMTEV